MPATDASTQPAAARFDAATDPTTPLGPLLQKLGAQLEEGTVGGTTAARHTADTLIEQVASDPTGLPVALKWIFRALIDRCPSASGWDHTLAGLRKVLRPIFRLVVDPTTDSEQLLLLIAQQLLDRSSQPTEPIGEGPPAKRRRTTLDKESVMWAHGRGELAVQLLQEEWMAAGLLWCLPLLVHQAPAVLNRWFSALVQQEEEMSKSVQSVLAWLLLSDPERVVLAVIEAATTCTKPARVVALLAACAPLLGVCAQSAAVIEWSSQISPESVAKLAEQPALLALAATALSEPSAAAAGALLIRTLDRWCRCAGTSIDLRLT